MSDQTPILQLKNYQAHFHTRRGIVKAVNGLSFEVRAGETLGIVGESGSGKSVTQLSYLRLLPSPPLRIVGGEVWFKGINLLEATDEELRKIRGHRISMIFQEPMTSLNPYMKIGKQMIEPLMLHEGLTKEKAWAEAIEALKRVGLPDAESAMTVYPHEFSGGMRQRVMIAMALTTKPEVLIADEPTTALDVTVQAQILELLKKIQKETGMSIVLITHDLGVIAGLADRVVVMYSGRVMEYGTVDEIFSKSEHPYTNALLKSTPRLTGSDGPLPVIEGSPPDLSKVGPGCPFFDRCDYKMGICQESFPAPHHFENQHLSYCHLEELPR